MGQQWVIIIICLPFVNLKALYTHEVISLTRPRWHNIILYWRVNWDTESLPKVKKKSVAKVHIDPRSLNSHSPALTLKPLDLHVIVLSEKSLISFSMYCNSCLSPPPPPLALEKKTLILLWYERLSLWHTDAHIDVLLPLFLGFPPRG